MISLWNIRQLTDELSRRDTTLSLAVNHLIDESYALGVLIHLFDPEADQFQTFVVSGGQVFYLDQFVSPFLLQQARMTLDSEQPTTCKGSGENLTFVGDTTIRCSLNSIMNLPLKTSHTGVFGCVQYFNRMSNDFDYKDLIIAEKYIHDIEESLYAHGINHEYRPEHETLIAAQGLTVEFGSGEQVNRAVDHVDLEIRKGELTMILGASGSGKTSMLNALGGMRCPTAGSIISCGDDITRYNDRQLTDYRRDRIAFVFQQYNLLADLTVGENVALAASLSSHPMETTAALELVGMEWREGHSATHHSLVAGNSSVSVSLALWQNRSTLCSVTNQLVRWIPKTHVRS